MQSIIMRGGILAAAFIVCLGGSAHAATIEVNVPFPFVVNGKTLPAGEYRVENDRGVVLLQGEKENHGSAFVMTVPTSGRRTAGDQPALTFTHYETQYRLADVWESGSEGLQVNR